MSIQRDQVWATRGDQKATVISTTMPGEFPVLAWVPHLMTCYRLIHTRANGTASARPGVPNMDDLLGRLT